MNITMKKTLVCTALLGTLGGEQVHILDGLDGTPITVTPFNIEPIHNNSGASIALGAACDSARLAFCGVVQKKHDSLSYT